MITKQVKEQHGAVICLDPKSVDSGSLWQAQLLSDRIIENALKYMKTDSTIFFIWYDPPGIGTKKTSGSEQRLLNLSPRLLFFQVGA